MTNGVGANSGCKVEVVEGCWLGYGEYGGKAGLSQLVLFEGVGLKNHRDILAAKCFMLFFLLFTYIHLYHSIPYKYHPISIFLTASPGFFLLTSNLSAFKASSGPGTGGAVPKTWRGRGEVQMVQVQVKWTWVQEGVSKNRGTPKSSISIWFSIINHPFWSILRYPYFRKHLGTAKTSQLKTSKTSAVPTGLLFCLLW